MMTPEKAEQLEKEFQGAQFHAITPGQRDERFGNGWSFWIVRFGWCGSMYRVTLRTYGDDTVERSLPQPDGKPDFFTVHPNGRAVPYRIAERIVELYEAK